MPAILVLSDFSRAFDEGLEEWKLDMFRQRHEWWKRLGELAGWDIALVDTADALAEPLRLQCSRVCFIDMPLLRKAKYRQFWQHCKAQSFGALVLAPPDEVERIQFMDRYYPLLREHGIDTIRTAFVPIADSLLETVQSAEDVQERLGDAMTQALVADGLELKRGLYIRTFLSSLRNSHPAYYFAHTPPQLAATSWRVLQMLRGQNDVGGLALREFLPLEGIDLPRGEHGEAATSVNLEMRVTVLEGRTLMANFHGSFLQLSPGQQEALRHELVKRRPRIDEGWELVHRLRAVPLPPNYVADIAYPKKAPPVVIELNPFYSAGSNVPEARAWLLVNLAAALAGHAGYARVPAEQLRTLATTLCGTPIRTDGALILGEEIEAALC